MSKYTSTINTFISSSENISQLDRGSIRSEYGLSTPYRLNSRNSAGLFHHVLINKGDLYLVLPGCWHFDYGATSKIDDVLTKHGGLLRVLPLTVHLNFFYGQVGGTIV